MKKKKQRKEPEKKTHSIRMESKPGSRDRDVFCLRFFIFISAFFFFRLHFSSNAFHYRMHHLVYVLDPISWARIRVANTFYESRLDVIHP